MDPNMELGLKDARILYNTMVEKYCKIPHNVPLCKTRFAEGFHQ